LVLQEQFFYTCHARSDIQLAVSECWYCGVK